MFKPYKYEKKEYCVDHCGSRSILQKIGNCLSFRSVITLRYFVSAILVSSGVVVMVAKVLFPVVTIHANTINTEPIISPVAGNESTNLSKKADTDKFIFSELSAGFKNNIKYENRDGILIPLLSESKTESLDNAPKQFYLSIPKLDIENAKVDANSLNLDPIKALGHFNGSCLPDEPCNTLIFGHSTFKGIRNRYESGDYGAVFSRLNELEYGDEFVINYRGKEYRYVVDFTKIDNPADVDPLENPYPRSFHKNSVTLFTCEPPGTTKYRLSIVGKLVE